MASFEEYQKRKRQANNQDNEERDQEEQDVVANLNFEDDEKLKFIDI